MPGTDPRLPMPQCGSCEVSRGDVFCHLPPETLQGIDAIRQMARYPKGAIVFAENDAPRGAYIICSGRVKLSIASMSGQQLDVGIADTGSVLGLASVCGRRPHTATAETVEPCCISYLPRIELLRLLEDDKDAALGAMRNLGLEVRQLHTRLETIGLRRRAGAKLRRLLPERLTRR